MNKKNLSLESIVQASEDQVSCDLDGEAAILQLKAGMYYGTDPVGARIWNLLQEPRSVGEIRDTLLKEYEVSESQCEQDLFLILEKFRKEDLIRVCD